MALLQAAARRALAACGLGPRCPAAAAALAGARRALHGSGGGGGEDDSGRGATSSRGPGGGGDPAKQGTADEVASATAASDQPHPEGASKPGEELYARPDRDPLPSPAASLTQDAASKAGMARSPEPLQAPDAYPLRNDPSVAGGGLGPSGGPAEAPLPQDESHGPKAAGQEAVNAGEFVPKRESREGKAGGV
ncbi:hypothetical protein Rsub_10293 [Raphidocelis subcapitata]|uniref:Uncharacterized protein n=1 Tax=Raphidocelis subcapitata TaxID=307507 RepID=A0A2V0PLZ6_9CHLO|nr:hypothetical protein Rsub_10293 [Raphidocelis subcapitata]|eukprot:GBF98065.1 hypothetical protein Rsub_10293 [Raphidocelis subcapitata]